MGQPHAKDSKAPSQPVRRPNPVLGRGGGVRTQNVSDALVAHRTTTDDTRTTTVASDHAAGTLYSNAVAQHGHGTDVVDLSSQPLSPVVIRYKNVDVKQLLDKKVSIDLLLQKRSSTGGAVEWCKMPMSRSEDNYFLIVDLPPGQHQFRFVIGDQVKVDPTQPTVNQLDTATPPEPSNVLVVSSDVINAKDDDDLIDDGQGWGQMETQFDETRKYPPILPPHLRYTPLNTPPTQVRCQVDGSLNVAQNTLGMLEAEHLPLPLSVTINHVYFQKRDDHVVSGMTTRCSNKFTTIAYYRSIPTSITLNHQQQQAAATSSLLVSSAS